jgi:dihydrofolate reductase
VVGEIVVSEFVSLDGVFEDPGGAESYAHGGWAFRFKRGEDGDRFKLEELREAEAHLLGRVTYEGFAKAWPDMEHSTGEFGEKMNAFPKYVLSSGLAEAGWRNSTILRGTLDEEIPRLKQRVAGPILVAGSGTLVQGLLAAGLVDELRLMVFPIVLGSGRRLFGDAEQPVSLTLADVRPVGPDGVVVLTYRR